MSNTALASLSTIGFAACALATLFLVALLMIRGRGRGSGTILLIALSAEVVWAVVSAIIPVRIGISPLIYSLAEALRILAWAWFLASLVKARVGVMIGLVALFLLPVVADQLGLGSTVSFSLRVLGPIAGLTCVEQVWRNTALSRRWAIKLLCVALLAKFAFDLAMYSDALLFHQMDAVWWTVRGFANAMLVPLIAVSAARNPDWKLDVGVSRQVVFHSATLTAAGTFLLAVAIVGYLLKFLGGSWGPVAATVFGFAALVSLLVLAASGTVRSAMRVAVAKHFFSYRYDYRHEWLKLTRQLGDVDRAEAHGTGVTDQFADLAHRGLKSLADLVESPGGALWTRDEDGSFRCEARIGRAGTTTDFAANQPWLEYMRSNEWIVDLRGAGRAPARQGEDLPPLPDWMRSDSDAAFLVPLLLDHRLAGVALLNRPRIAFELDWEARDLLKIAARQVASYLTVRRTVEALVQARQFESFNRMSAFVVHDLKNLIAQLSLMTRNAERHKANPEFQQDMLDTVRNVVERMQGLLLQLGPAGAKPIAAPEAVALCPLLLQIVKSTPPRGATIHIELDPLLSKGSVTAHPQRLTRVLGHLLQNAVEAAGDKGSVKLQCTGAVDHAVIEITDNGPGMTEDFIRSELFRAFSSTKPGGMGIGAFETREYVRELSGSIEVVSIPTVGSKFTIRLPLRMPSSVFVAEPESTEIEMRQSVIAPTDNGHAS